MKRFPWRMAAGLGLAALLPAISSVPITAYALRRDNYDEDIHLTLADPPAGFTLDAPANPCNQDKVRLTLTVPKTTTPEPISLEMEGHSKSIRGRALTRVAVPAEAWMQAFAYWHLVPAKDWTVMEFNGPGQIIVGTGRVLRNIDTPQEGGCRTSVELAMDRVGDVAETKGFHQLFIYGNLEQPLRAYGKLAGIEVLPIA